LHEKLTYLIVDDDDLDREVVAIQASAFPFLHCIAACSQPLEAIELTKRFRPDIIFVDIEMRDINGLELVSLLAGKVAAPVFITSHPEYALESYEQQAFDYIVKPLTPDRFKVCVHRLRDFFELRSKASAYDIHKNSDEIIIKQGHDKHRITISDILYLEAMKDYTRIVTLMGQYLVLNSLSKMMEQLPAEKFMRIHRSFMVNRQRVSAFKGDTVHILAHELPVSRQYRNILRRTL
jgi:DNA-binding LytR/AlgR family response regulator